MVATLSNLTFDDFQAIQLEWANENFGDQPAEYALLGLAEELGELSRAHLKSLQGIRGDEAKWSKEARKEIGDIVTFLAQYASARGWSLGDCVEESWQITSDRSWKDFPQKGTGTNGIPISKEKEADTTTGKTQLKTKTQKKKKKKAADKKGIAISFPDRWSGVLPKPEQLANDVIKALNAASSETKKQKNNSSKMDPLNIALAVLGKVIDGTLIVDNPTQVQDKNIDKESTKIVNCPHDWVYDGHGHNESYYICKHCKVDRG